LWDPVPRGLAIAQVFLQFAALGYTVNLRGKFDATSAQRTIALQHGVAKDVVKNGLKKTKSEKIQISFNLLFLHETA